MAVGTQRRRIAGLQRCLVRIMAAGTREKILAMLAGLPLEVRFGVAVAAQLAIALDGDGFFGVIGIDRAVAGRAGDTGGFPRLGLFIVARPMAAHARRIVGFCVPGCQKFFVRSSGAVRASHPAVVELAMARQTIVGCCLLQR